jgi:hypothetical protein
MKTILLSLYILLLTVTVSFGQDKTAGGSETLIDLYFKPYSGEPKYEVNTMGEAMVKRTNEMGMWKHPAIARIMQQVKMYKYLNFNGESGHLQQVVAEVDAAMKKGSLYKEYFKWEMNNAVSSIIYTRSSGNKIIEVDYVTTSKSHLSVSCFVGDNINMESIRALAENK